MSTSELDPLIHDPARLRIVATLATLPDGDALSVIRLQDMLGLSPGSLTTRLGELDYAGYVQMEKTGGDGAQTTAALTCNGRAALDDYYALVRQLAQVSRQDQLAPAPYVRVGDAERDAAAAVLGEYFAQGRMTLDELSARLDAILTATTHGELSRAARDLPDLTVLSGGSVSRNRPFAARMKPAARPSRNSMIAIVRMCGRAGENNGRRGEHE